MATTEVEQHVKVETEGGVGWIRLNRPEKMNAIGALTRKQLGDAIKQAKEGHSKATAIVKQVCDAAAQGPRPAGPTGDFWVPRPDCRVCGETGDFGWPPGFQPLR